jgi:hypothetical protein
MESTYCVDYLEYSSVMEVHEWLVADALEMPWNATQHVFQTTPGDGWTNGARQHHVSAACTSVVLLRRNKLDRLLASSGIRVQRHSCAWN